MTTDIQRTTKKFSNDARMFALLWGLTILMVIGMGSNLQAVLANGGKMPVQYPNQNNEKHYSFQDKSDVNYYYLTDIIYLKYSMVSIGDVIMVVSWLGMIISVFVYRRKEVKK